MSEVQALFSILRQSAEPRVADAIQRLVETGADRDLNRINLLDLSKKTGLPDIVGTPRYRPVTVDGGSGSAASSNGGDIEVALDQESILSTAPNANQRPYFAPNSGSGYIDAISAVFDDVTQDKHATKRGDPHIVALSTSWGSCSPSEAP